MYIISMVVIEQGPQIWWVWTADV